MIAVRLPQKLDHKLNREAKRLGRTKSALVQQAIVDFLEGVQDTRDADAVMARIARGKERIHSSAAVKRALKL